ncbi:MAG TPA: tripartite tricarboxylate transporter substrate binding protein [Xanthobacteraceae bacterium]|nr:tripartite tricarboxylate transporter substrate binding protein [Xanthobacteraceae bacterium]
MRRLVTTLLFLVAGWAAAAAAAQAQPYPARPIHIIAPYAPGGIADIASRLIGQKLTEAWGQQVVVENRPGANGFLGVTAVTRAPPDGYTLLVATTGDLTINPVLFKKTPYDVQRDLIPITTLSDTPCLLVANANTPYKTVADVLAAARKNPGNIPMGSPGIGSINQLAFEWMGLGTGTKFLHVPYKGGAPAATALAGGEIPLAIVAISSATPFLQNNRIRVIALTSAKRSSFNPEWPTLQEGGVPEVDASNWTALLAPAGTPQPIIDKLHQAVVDILAMPDIQQRFAAGGATVVPTSAAELDARIRRETAAFKTIVDKANIHVE